MGKFAVVLALISLGAGGYSLYELKKSPSASAESLEALQKEVTALTAALDTEAKAREAAEARVQQAELAAQKRDERLVALEAGKGDSGPLTTTELIVQSADGKRLLRLGATKSGGGAVVVYAKNGKRAADLVARPDDDGELRVYDEAGALGANIGGNDTGGYANFYGPGKRLAAYIGADADKPHGYMAVYGPDRKELVGLYGNAKGGVVSVRGSEANKQVLMLAAEPNTGHGFIGVGNKEGKPALALFVTDNGGQVKALNAEGEAAAFIGVSANPAGNGLFYLSRTNGQRVVEAGTTAKGGGYASIHNSEKKRVLFLGASSGTAPDDGVVEVAQKNGKLGVVLRGYSGGSSVRVYDNNEKVKANIR